MTEQKLECDHRCRNTCALLAGALKDEKKIVEYFETVLAKCDDPGIVAFVKELRTTHARVADEIESKLNEIKANAEILDDIIEGFDN